MASEHTKPEQTPAQDALAAWVSEKYQALARGRWAEEREWYRAGMFKQLKQWLTSDTNDKKSLKEIKRDKNNRFFMPVSDHFSKAIDTNANMLGAAIPEMLALTSNYDARNRRAAEAAENALDEANRESGLNILTTTLSQHVVLFGMGITKETIAFDHSTDEVPEMHESEPTIGPDGQPVEAEPQVVGTQNIPSPRLKTELPMLFQVYLPRDCYDANLAKVIIERPRMTLSEARELYPDFADTLTKDDGDDSEYLAQYFQNSLRYLSYSNGPNDSDEKVTLTECWVDWNELSKEVQDAIEEEWQSEPSILYGDQGMSKLEAARSYGIFVTQRDKTILEWGENPWDGLKPYTFYQWEKDVANVYPKGLSVPLIPLQTQLNRYHSLADRSIMSNAAVKILWPTTQTGPAPTGNPVDIITWDPIGEGKVKPEWVSGRSVDPLLISRMMQIVEDMNDLAMMNQASEGESPGAGTAFRALAFMASKTEDQRKTHRFLWESSHELRARKVISIIRKIWSSPRKVLTAGFNNRYGAQQLQASDLQGDYELNVQQDSSRPRTMTEKLEVFQLMLQGGMVNPADPTIREYVTDTLGMSDINLADHLDYQMAERNLDTVKNGLQPESSPFMNYPLHLSIFAEFTKTEEFFSLDPKIQAGIIAYATWLQQMVMPPSPPQGAGPANPTGPDHPLSKALAAKGGVGGQPASHVMGQVPGATVSTGQVQRAAAMEADRVVPNIPANS